MPAAQLVYRSRRSGPPFYRRPSSLAWLIIVSVGVMLTVAVGAL